MEDIRPELTRLGGSIVAEHLKTGKPLSTLLAKEAADKSLKDGATKMLVGITNKEYVKTTGNTEFSTAKVEEVYDHLYTDNTREKVAYMFPEFDSNSVAKPRQKSASLGLVETNSEKPIDFSAVLRELSTKSVGEVKSKRAALYLECNDQYQKVFNNVCILKTLGFTDVELRSKLAALGLEQPAGKLVSGIYGQSPKTKSAFSSRAQYNVEGYLNGIVEAARLLSEKTASFLAADRELGEALKKQKATYDFGKILL